MAGRARRTPRGTLDREVILRTATTIMDEHGIGALTTRRIADELNVRPMALYTYFRSKDEILSALYDELIATIEIPRSTDDGVMILRQMMLSYYRLITEHGELLRITIANELSSANELRLNETIYAILLDSGLDRRNAMGFGATLVRFTLGSAAVYAQRRPSVEDPSYWPQVRQAFQALPMDDYPTLRWLGAELPEFTQQQAYEFGLDVLLEHIQRLRG